MRKDKNQAEQGVIKTNAELDSTLLVIFGSVLAFLVVVGIFTIHILSPTDSLLSPEILMALIMLPSTLISFAMGKRLGRTEVMAGQSINGTNQQENTR